MHEYSLVQSLLRQVEALRQQHGAACVTEVHLKIGEFSGVDADLLAEAFRELAAGHWSSPVQLFVERVPLTASCQACHESFFVQRFRFECPSCGAKNVTITEGEGLILDRLQMVSEEN